MNYSEQMKLQERMVMLFISNEILAFENEHPELTNMNGICIITNVYQCDGLGVVYLEEKIY